MGSAMGPVLQRCARGWNTDQEGTKSVWLTQDTGTGGRPTAAQRNAQRHGLQVNRRRLWDLNCNVPTAAAVATGPAASLLYRIAGMRPIDEVKPWEGVWGGGEGRRRRRRRMR